MNRKIDEKEISKQLSARLPAIAVPRKYQVFESLPKMGSGKIDFRTTTEMVKSAVRNEREQAAKKKTVQKKTVKKKTTGSTKKSKNENNSNEKK